MSNLTQFINEYVTKRNRSMFQPDIESHRSELEERINGKTLLAIDDADSIDNSFNRALLPYRISANPHNVAAINFFQNTNLTENHWTHDHDRHQS